MATENLGEQEDAEFGAAEFELAFEGGGIDGRAATLNLDTADRVGAEVVAEALEVEGEDSFDGVGAGEGGGVKFATAEVDDAGIDGVGVEEEGEFADESGAGDGGVRIVEPAFRLGSGG